MTQTPQPLRQLDFRVKFILCIIDCECMLKIDAKPQLCVWLGSVLLIIQISNLEHSNVIWERPKSQEKTSSIIQRDIGEEEEEKNSIAFWKKTFSFVFFIQVFNQQRQKKCKEEGVGQDDYSKPVFLFLLKCFIKKTLAASLLMPGTVQQNIQMKSLKGLLSRFILFVSTLFWDSSASVLRPLRTRDFF